MSGSEAARAQGADGDSLAGVQERVLNTLLAMQRQSWEQGLAGHAALDLGRHDLAQAFARDAVLRQTAAGKLAEIDDTLFRLTHSRVRRTRRRTRRRGRPEPGLRRRGRPGWDA